MYIQARQPIWEQPHCLSYQRLRETSGPFVLRLTWLICEERGGYLWNIKAWCRQNYFTVSPTDRGTGEGSSGVCTGERRGPVQHDLPHQQVKQTLLDMFCSSICVLSLSVLFGLSSSSSFLAMASKEKSKESYELKLAAYKPMEMIEPLTQTRPSN